MEKEIYHGMCIGCDMQEEKGKDYCKSCKGYNWDYGIDMRKEAVEERRQAELYEKRQEPRRRFLVVSFILQLIVWGITNFPPFILGIAVFLNLGKLENKMDEAILGSRVANNFDFSRVLTVILVAAQWIWYGYLWYSGGFVEWNA